MQSTLLNFYTRNILNRPIIVIIVLLGVFSYLGYNAKHFRIDASADSLILENDEDYKYYREVSKTYGSHSYMFVTYKPEGDLLSTETLSKLSSLRGELREIKRVSSVLTILDVPLLRNPPAPIKELISNIKTLENPEVDLQLARTEIESSPIYKELLVSTDMKMTALMVHFAEDAEYDRIVSRRGDLKQKLHEKTIIPAERVELEQLKHDYRACKIRMDKERHSDIAAVREIMDGYREDAELFLGGISMITDDLITFVKKDLKVFGAGIVIFLIVVLGVIFRKVCWVVLPILCCALSVFAMIGILGIFGWEVTVISSNFISLQLIITMALTIHLIVRYRELQVDNPEWSQMELVRNTVFSKFVPCLYTTLTTVAGFGSLLICDILPVITFGLMMSVGLVVSLIVTFFLFPAILCLIPKGKSGEDRQFCRGFTRFLANVTQNYAKTVFIVTGLLIAMIAVGVSRLTVENSFIDYFRESTEIYQGLKVIDQNLGGTTPLDIIVNFQETGQDTEFDEFEEENSSDHSLANDEGGTDSSEGFDEFDEFDEFEEEDSSDKYWFTASKMARIMKVHDYLESLPEIGKVLSLGTMLKIAEEFTDGKPLDDFQLALLYTQLPDNFRGIALDPFISIPDNQARLTVRIKDSLKGLKRDNLLNQIRFDMENKLGLQGDQYHLAGMMVLYNNMLQSLFSSQILTIGFVVLALVVMFTVLFRSIKIALIAIIPNVISAVSVLGVMGLAGMPLDFITITIAAISIGIAVDDTVHYIHRFKEEYEVDQNYINSMHRCHGSIGNAMYYTSLTIIAGFSILVLSYFIPTILFGLLTGLAMFIALITALTLLPRLIIVFKPFGK